MRRFSCCILALFVLGPVARAAEIRAFEDATLRAVHFVDDNVGWAVGDDGVIWNTLDAGKHWDRQPTGVKASLRSVQFIDHNVGWVAGRQELPERQRHCGSFHEPKRTPEPRCDAHGSR